ncbi:Bug family tripartite tricarboxylate transporter substrate binding protein [Rhodopseudomonas sp. P2A-2r]|uniref:Bug family tripartite tricarboxylate transporter substrate binding protein n=1 Tax=unclassified Rhodopseudomonas TaxID=2638247 RepID=UPI0022345D72|nr:tripartite tricarboxylate transporter substrate binding protein [Rhodopseudomonas sp. P2A-2r]UZE49916.1 tripartite tricarboxylate transporter substrate binding protein [Rhodopseudomonas sp. P2A-2r]
MQSRRTFLDRAAIVLAAVGCVAIGATGAAAQQYPTKPIQLIVPFAAGGAADIIGRTIAEKLGQIYGQQVIVDNRAGAGSNIGINAAAKSPPDGYTLVLASIAVAVNPWLFKSMPYDPAKDLTPLTLALETPNVVLVPASSSIKNIKDLIAFAKERAKTGGATYGSAGIGSSLHLAAEMFRQQANVELTHVPYRGSSPALTDLMSGRIDLMFDNASTALPQVQGGSVRAIAVTTKERIAALPDVPTIAESGVPGFELANWWAIFGPGHMPPELAERVSADIRKILADPDVQKRFADVSGRVIASTPQELAAHLAKESAKWKQVVDAAGIRGSQ